MWLSAVIVLTGRMLVVVGNQLGLATEFRNDFTVHGHDKKVGAKQQCDSQTTVKFKSSKCLIL